jgi:hypothetical protein
VTIDVNKLVAKINFARASAMLKNKEMIEEHMKFPNNPEEEAEAVKLMVYSFLKKRFVGCKLRSNAFTFSLRLDGETHKKVKKVKDKIMNNAEWKQWFHDKQQDIYRIIERHQQIFHGNGIEMREKDGREFLYIPVQTNRIYQYQNDGLMEMLRFLDESYARETAVAVMYDRVVTIMEEEVKRREEETRRRITHDTMDYHRRIRENLLKPITKVNREGNTFEDKLGVLMYDWCVANGITPVSACYALEPTFDRVVPLGINVEILVRDEEADEDWYAVPTFGGYVVPEGFTLLQGYGDVTAHEFTGRRSREGAAPIVVIKHMYCQYDEKYWNVHFPERYTEILEATRSFATQVEAEVTQAEEQRKEMERTEREERHHREQELVQARLEQELAQKRADEQRTAVEIAEQERIQREEQERVERLRMELTTQILQAQEIEQAAEPNAATFPNGIYRNIRAIPFERYVVVVDGNVRRYATRTGAIDLLRGRGWTWTMIGERHVRDYYNIETIAEVIEI